MKPRYICDPLCKLDELEERKSRGFDPLDEGKDTMFVVRLGGSVHGWRNACPHYDYGRMAWKKDEFLDAERKHIMCGAHGALFEIASGRCVLGPCMGQKLTRVPLEIRNGAVYVSGLYAPGLRKNQSQSEER
ncbi:Rieske 2Fe-2S domain-containing protein [Breoghania sp.]|uniref:Rieske (2Fe-2S) protein n=1 Tax=Breoghania sp. TaxID=2065378 RepID=UPI0029C9EDEB|nr:Rieske 2Fe-2S domain-containing protein [Breoghania sp.]